MLNGIVYTIGLIGLIYLFIKLLGHLIDLKNVKLKKALTIIVWSSFLIYFGLGYYANHYFPHGEMYETGDIVCQYDDRQCGLEYKEDMRELDVPEWVKKIREYGFAPLMILGIVGIVVGAKKEE